MTHKYSSQLSFEISDFEADLIDLIQTTRAPGKWSAINALRHLNKAKKIFGVDNEMAAFRCITAEEEAVTAVYKSLKSTKYDDAERIDCFNHFHKHALFPFIKVCSSVFQSAPKDMPLKPEFYISKGKLSVQLRIFEGTEFEFVGQNPAPFDFNLFNAKKDGSKIILLSHEIRCYLEKTGDQSIWKHIKQKANVRNQILYAPQEGYPTVEIGESRVFFSFYKNVVFDMLKLFLLLDPYPPQLFIKQVLPAFIEFITLKSNEYEDDRDLYRWTGDM